MSVADENHCNSRLVARVNGKLILDATSRLDNCRNASLYTFLYTVAEGEEGVACHNRTLHLVSRVCNRLLRRPNAVGLSHTDTRRSVLFTDDDRV